jgi:DNA-binding NtrC family response regulator
VDLLKQGAADYITKPFDLDTLVEKIRAVCLRPRGTGNGGEHATLGISAAMRAVERTLCRVSGHNATVLITGESGVGKEHAARYLHDCAFGGQRRPFVAVNCGAIPESLMEAELFGFEKGAFTGALRTKKGVFEQAQGGTLFLDEIGEMPPMMQVRLLRVIQEHQVVRVGGEQTLALDVRIVCATNRNLKQMVADGSFREDLFYRVNVIHVELPPLRERREDILWFTRRFLDELGPDTGRHLLPSGEERLLHHDWPGNLRELKHCIERAGILSPDTGLGAMAFDEIGSQPTDDGAPPAELRERLNQYERHVIVEALARHSHQIGETAIELGISRKNLWEKMKKLGVD